jgi:hypothetical protein
MGASWSNADTPGPVPVCDKIVARPQAVEAQHVASQILSPAGLSAGEYHPYLSV